MKRVHTSLIFFAVLCLGAAVFSDDNQPIFNGRPQAVIVVSPNKSMSGSRFSSFEEDGGLTQEATATYATYTDIGAAGLVDLRGKSKAVFLVECTNATYGVTFKMIGYAKYGGHSESLIEDADGNTEFTLTAGQTAMMSTDRAWAAIKIQVKRSAGNNSDYRVEYCAKVGG